MKRMIKPAKPAAATFSIIALAFGVQLSAHAACSPITSAPYVISQSGNYCVQSDLNAGNISAPAAIIVDADNVTIDLQGNEISGPYSGGVQSDSIAVGVRSDNHSKITVRNGSLSGFYIGVQLNDAGPGNFLIEDLNVDAVVRDIIAWGQDEITVRHNRVSTNPYLYTAYDPSAVMTAIHVVSNGGTVEDNSLGSVGGKNPLGIKVSCNGCLVQGNYMAAQNAWATQTQGYGIKSEPGTTAQIIDNRIFSFRTGINIAAGTAVTKYGDNIVSSAETPYLGGTDIGNNR